MRQPNESSQLAPKPWYREPWPWLLMSGPAAVVVAGLATAYIAVANEDPLVVDNYYKEGLAINRVLKEDEAAAKGGYRAQVLFSTDGQRVRAHLVGSGSLPHSVRLTLAHPTRAALDRAVTLAATQGGWYEGALGIQAAKRWHVLLEDSEGGWRLTGDWHPGAGGETTLLPRG